VVPDVIGMDQEPAADTLMRTGFMAETTTVPGDQPAGAVVDQTPGPGAQVTEGATVELSVSDGMGIVEEPEPEAPDDDDDLPDDLDLDVPLPPDLEDLPALPDRGDWPPTERPDRGQGRSRDGSDQR
jgi:hypothetical protein